MSDTNVDTPPTGDFLVDGAALDALGITQSKMREMTLGAFIEWVVIRGYNLSVVWRDANKGESGRLEVALSSTEKRTHIGKRTGKRRPAWSRAANETPHT